MSLFTRVRRSIDDRRERLLSGKVNCIPWGLPRFEQQIPGIEQGKYYLLTANSKVGRLPLWIVMSIANTETARD